MRPRRSDRRHHSAAESRRVHRACEFCRTEAGQVDYKDVGALRRYVSDRGKIRARRITGTCEKHQRSVAQAVKNAREMALLPYGGTRG